MAEHHFLVVLCCRSAVRFREDESFTIRYNYPSGDSVFMAFKTHWADEGYEASVPRELWVEVRGTSESLESAIATFRSAADHIGSILAFATNAGRDPFEVDVAFDISPDADRHEYFQNFVRKDRWFPIKGRRPDSGAVYALMAALERHPRRKRLERAIAQYVHALSFLGAW